jgi:gas vesicle protein
MAMATNDNSTGSVLLAFAVGALAGAAVALLFAPSAGEDLRRKLADKAREGRDTLKSAVERGREAFDQARKESA